MDGEAYKESRRQLLAEMRAVPPQERIITALDVPGLDPALELAGRLGTTGRFVKVGLELFSASGPEVVSRLHNLGKSVFLDLKYHDIPNTVASAARIAARLGAAMVTIHASAGRAALTAAAEALATAEVPTGGRRPALLGVTILTSLDESALQECAPSAESLNERMERLASLAWECGCDGLVCAPPDLPRLRARLGGEPLVVTPGIRPAGSGGDDQRRVAGPREARAAGADFLVIGRPITRAADPAAALAELGAQLTA